MTYKMVTKEEIEAAANLRVKYVPAEDEYLERAGKLEELAERLLRERDAYREVAIRCYENYAHAQGTMLIGDKEVDVAVLEILEPQQKEDGK